MENYSVIDLFCGVGGLTHGFEKEGFDVVAGIDFDKSCEHAYNSNNKAKFIFRDIGDMAPQEIDALFPEGSKKILIGCAPCQPFSIFNRKNGGKMSESNDLRWKLLYAFANIIVKTKPDIISMENVPHLKGFKNGKVFNDFVSILEKEGYNISYEIHNAQDFGVPQRRHRLVLLGSLQGKIEMIPPSHKDNPVTVRETIGYLPPIQAGQISKTDLLHRARNLSELSMKRIKATPEGGGWKDWDQELIADCHKKEGGKAFGSAYGRMSWDKVAPTMTTYCIGYNNGRFGHPEQNRPISIREAALLQSFPENYDFIDPEASFSSGRLARHIGNAVPVLLGQAVAKSVARHVETIENVK
ncbi:DNA cytosine methyltransferase [Muricauda sp. 334s03]|uniref:Cytosine-specific methyltransferase n=1 Tax=Flagellimonas yonaguniensis TaxID=3031325 RepID=A0ABT5Y0H3_9FLAO|nr:DNA cytosine methyltransferase [[Muricauda] yonaguniensis]MDF0716943.1 DNA cytosine methyltransferase [[Muricauda] yonaguniensis]